MLERRRNYTAFIVESVWILPSVAIPVGMFVALVLTVYLGGIHLPGATETIDPARVEQTPPFDHPGLREVAPGKYVAVLIAQTWSWTPNELHIPVGSTVTFHVASKDVTHGLFVENTTINEMVIPGLVSHLTYTFTRPGEYPMFCHEYCGAGHQAMAGKIVVEGQK
jgi:cytochrome c oxidase subunit II